MRAFSAFSTDPSRANHLLTCLAGVYFNSSVRNFDVFNRSCEVGDKMVELSFDK